MDRRDHENGPVHSLTPEAIQAYYAKVRREFTEEDAKWYDNPGELVPFEDVIREIEDYIEEKGLQGDAE